MKSLRRTFKLQKSIKILKFKEDWVELKTKFVYTDNPGENITNIVKISNKTGHKQKTLIATASV